ncbi:MAG: MFS transporter [Anaerolineaceae bacterium]|nr:MFS transporter [Anaerolineaceae bacterium]
MKKSMWLIYLVAFMGVAGFTAAMPIMPFFVKAMGGNTIDIGMVLGLTALVAVFSGPIVGYYGDHIGRRPVLIASMFGFAAWYACFFFARSMLVVYIGAFIGGIVASGALSVATAYATDVAGPQKAGGVIAYMQAAQMVGALLPPLAAGFLAEVNVNLPFGALGVIALVIGALMIPFLAESMPSSELNRVKGQSLSPFSAVSSSFRMIFGYFRTPIGPLLLLAFLIAFPTGFFQTALPLLTGDAGLGTSETGIIMSTGTFAIVLVNVFLVGWLIKKLGLWGNILVGMVAAAIFYVMLPFCNSFWAFMIVNLLLSISTASMRPAHITLVSNNATASDQSVAQAAYNQWTAIGNIFGPTLSGYLYGAVGGVVTFGIAAALFLAGSGYAGITGKKSAIPKLHTA